MPPAPTPVPSLPGTKQRLVLSFDRTDPLAASIAARLKAAWEEVQLMIDLDGVEPPTLRDRMLRGEHHVALVLHQPPPSDPVLALRGTLGVRGAGHEDAVDALRRAEALADPGSRWEAAAAAEARLLVDSRLIPLVRLHAWLATDERLVGIATTSPGVLRLDDAFLRP